jgi:hypothetical protein
VACVEVTVYVCAVVELCGGGCIAGVLKLASVAFSSLWVVFLIPKQPDRPMCLQFHVPVLLMFLRCCVSPQLVIAESNPGLDGHKLAASLCKVPSIGVTLIPDSNIYALMARVNKVDSMARCVLYSILEYPAQVSFRLKIQN